MKIAIPTQLQEELRRRIAAIAPHLELVALSPDGQAEGPYEDAEAMLRWEMDGETLRTLLPRMPRLRWLHTASAGVDRLLIPELRVHPCLLTNSAGAYAIPIAEHIIAMLMVVAKEIPAYLRHQREHRWKRVHAAELYEQTLAIIGAGHIGRETARRAQGLGMRTIATRRHPQPTPFIDQIYATGELHTVLAQADYAAITCPLTPETEGLIGEAELRTMKRTAWLINVARGRIIQEQALLQALSAGWIAGACLDTFAQEPLPAESPFWEMPNVILTPHNSWSSPRTRERLIALFLENLERFLAGEALLNVVDKERGY